MVYFRVKDGEEYGRKWLTMYTENIDSIFYIIYYIII